MSWSWPHLLVFLQLQMCLLLGVVSTVLSVVAVIIYSVDMGKNPEESCMNEDNRCDDIPYATVSASFHFHYCANFIPLSLGTEPNL